MGHLAVATKCQSLVESYLSRNYKDSRAREYAVHGFSRRLKTLTQCIDNVFKILPPDRTELPSIDELFDAMINIQAFVFNLFGSIDNLAWIWVWEKPVRREDGSEIHKSKIGLGNGEKYKYVRGSFSPGFQQHLTELHNWFDYLENFRHALAHRIPLYIAPCSIPRDKEAHYRQLEDRKIEAMKCGDFAECNRLKAEQNALGTFLPEIRRSFEEQSGAVRFHPQLLTDFLTIEALAQKMLEELDP